MRSTPSSFASSRARRAMRARSSAGSSRTASPRRARISLSSHSSLPTGSSRRARRPRACGRPVRPPSGRPRARRGSGRCGRRAGGSARSRRAARSARGSASRCASGRAGRSARRVARRVPGVHVPVRQLPLERVGLDEPRRRRSRRPPSGTRSRRAGARAIAAGERRDELLLGARPAGSASASARTRRTSPRACGARGRAACARPAAIIGPTNSSASRIARASSGVSRGGAAGRCRRRAPCRRAPRRRAARRRPCSSRRRS